MAIIALLTISLLGPSTVLQVDSSNENRETIKNSSCVVCINELMPNADGSDQGIYPQGEWVELLNTGSSSVNPRVGQLSILVDGHIQSMKVAGLVLRIYRHLTT